jgi:predicted MFS family arabinose efflux permease
VSWFVGSACLGLLYDRALPALIGVSAALYLGAALVLFYVARRQ